MFTYEWNDSFLHKRNPIIKLGLVFFVTIMISLSLYPALPAATFVMVWILGQCGGKMPFVVLLKKMRVFIGIGMTFMVFMLLMKGIDSGGYDYQFWMFHWNSQDFISILALGMRIMSISLMSLLFVVTTDPNELVLSLILQLHVSPVHGYATLAAYRFLPTLQAEVENIQLAQQIRGVEWGKGMFNRMKTPFRIMLPLLCSAARRGERVAAAMESRGLFSDAQRSYYKRTKVDAMDWIFLISASAVLVGCIIWFIKYNMFRFSFGFALK